MKWSRTRGSEGRRRLLGGRGQKGFVLIELLIAIAIFGVISVGFLSALVAGYHGVIVAHDQRTAHTLTRTTLENVRRAQFPVTDNQSVQSKFRVSVEADYVDKDYKPVTGTSSMQMITVTITYNASGKSILVTQEAKVKS